MGTMLLGSQVKAGLVNSNQNEQVLVSFMKGLIFMGVQRERHWEVGETVDKVL